MPDYQRYLSDSRRQFLRTMGSLTIAIPFLPGCFSGEAEQTRIDVTLEELPGSLRRTPDIDSWLEVLEDGRVRIFSGKVELGQGIRNAVRQVAADELYMDLDRVEVVLAETGRTPNEGYTAGSGSIQNSAMAVRHAAAAAREQLLELAAAELQTTSDQLWLDNGNIKLRKGRKQLSFAEILKGRQLEGEVPLTLKLKPKNEYRYVGKAIPRADVKEVVRGAAQYIHDLDFPGMVHARVLRPKNYQSELLHFDEVAFNGEAEGMLKIVRNGNFLGVITAREYEVERAVQLLEKHTEWSRPAIFPKQGALSAHIKSIAEAPETVYGKEAVINPSSAELTLKANYFKPYTMHAALGPACAIAQYDGDILHVWSHSQGIYPMREGLAVMLGLELDKIHVISSPGSGAYGHTVADDAASDAAVMAMAYPGKHIRVRWSRADEHRWEPYGSAMLMELEAGVGADGKLSFWRANIWTDSHSTRPNKDAGTLLTARYLDPAIPMNGRGYLGGGHRNGDPYYDIPQMQVLAHYFDGPLRVSSLRSLGAYANIFAIESFMDELAEKTGQDAIAFRIKHLQDERALDVIQAVRDMIAGVDPAENEGLGFAFCRYKNNAAYCSMAAQVHVDPGSGTVKLLKCWVAVDVGEVINPDSMKNQVQGGIIQAAGWTLWEEVTFDEYEITSKDWVTYSTMRLMDTPDIEVRLIDRPEASVMGGGEVSVPPVAAAICNAIYNAGGRRVYRLPVRQQLLSSY
ncbi:MAG: molybdopterin cofactor-binding domain-containing protein [Saprospiraceae bacterium]|nr:xanthine dehydrogenase family protein molybdopterin-binding subunit [Lewinella sp.]